MRERMRVLDEQGWLGLEFVARPGAPTVHVVVPVAPAWMDQQDAQLVAGDDVDDLLLGSTPTLCGYVLPSTGRLTVFADERLCRRCVRVLGPLAPRAFEHPRG